MKNIVKIYQNIFKMSTYTLTFGDRAENHVGMQIIGKQAKRGFSRRDFDKIQRYFLRFGTVERINLSELTDVQTEHAELLICRNILDKKVLKKLLKEQKDISYDTKALMRKRVVNKHARHNVCFGDEYQEANFEEGKGTIIPFSDLPTLSRFKRLFEKITGVDLQCEGNYYYDIKKTYIGFHGDSERKIVIAIRLGESFPLYYQWYQNSKKIGRQFSTMLNSGDIYFMSEKAVGTDWKKRKIPTLRHAAGFKLPK